MATPTTLPASFTAGNVLTAAQMNALRGSFRVLQVVYAQYATQVNTSLATYVDTGLSATITPSSTSSKILVMVNQNGAGKTSGNAGQGARLKLFRGATDIGVFAYEIGYTGSSIDNYGNSCSYNLLDSPATTSATTYKTQFAGTVAAASAVVQALSSVSQIVLLEISA